MVLCIFELQESQYRCTWFVCWHTWGHSLAVWFPWQYGHHTSSHRKNWDYIVGLAWVMVFSNFFSKSRANLSISLMGIFQLIKLMQNQLHCHIQWLSGRTSLHLVFYDLCQMVVNYDGNHNLHQIPHPPFRWNHPLLLAMRHMIQVHSSHNVCYFDGMPWTKSWLYCQALGVEDTQYRAVLAIQYNLNPSIPFAYLSNSTR